MKKRLSSILLALAVVLALPGTAWAVEGPDYQTALIAQLEAGARPSANNLFLGISQWKEMEEGPEKAALAMRYAAVKRLDMSGMGLKQKSDTSDDLALLEPFLGLEELDLSTREDTPSENQNALTDLNYLSRLTGLRKLDVSNNHLKAGKDMTDGISGLLGSMRLETLDLSGNRELGSSGGVVDALSPLAWLPSVRELDLSGTGFANDDVQYVQDMFSLRVLDVSGTPVRDLDLRDLTGLTSLKAEDLTLDSLKLPPWIDEVSLAGTKLRVTGENAEDAMAAMRSYGDSGLKLVNAGNTSQEVYPVSVAAPANGAAEASAKTAAQGEKVTVTVAPEEGYALDSIAVSYKGEDGGSVSVPVTDGAFTMPGADVTVTVRFMRQDIVFQYNEADKGSIAFDKKAPARGERVSFVTDLADGYQVRQITGKIGTRSVPVYRGADGTYCFDMPRLGEDEALVFNVTIVEVVAAKYSASGAFGGQLTLSGLVEGQRYVCQMSDAGAGDAPAEYTIVTFTAQESTERLEVRASARGYLVSLWKYDEWASSVSDLINVIYEVPANG